MQIITLEQRHEGAMVKVEDLLDIQKKKGNDKKDATYDYKHIDWEKHFKGERISWIVTS